MVDLEEVDREKKIQEALVKVGSSPNLPPPKPSGDFKIAVYIGAKTKECVTVEVSGIIIIVLFFGNVSTFFICFTVCNPVNMYITVLCTLSVLNSEAFIYFSGETFNGCL